MIVVTRKEKIKLVTSEENKVTKSLKLFSFNLHFYNALMIFSIFFGFVAIQTAFQCFILKMLVSFVGILTHLCDSMKSFNILWIFLFMLIQTINGVFPLFFYSTVLEDIQHLEVSMNGVISFSTNSILQIV